MDWYWKISDDNDILLIELLKQIDQDGIKPLGDWRAVYYKGYDGYLVNIAYNIIKNSKVCDKTSLAVELYKTLKPIFVSVGDTSKEDFNNIVENIWCSVFEVGGQKYFIKTLARKNRPLWRKITDNNTFLIAFFVFMIVVGYNISEFIYMPEIERYDEWGNYESNAIYESFFISVCLNLVSIFGVAIAGETVKNHRYGVILPLSTAILVCLGQIILYTDSSESFQVIQMCKRWLLVAFLQFLWIPIWIINEERLSERKEPWEDMYRKHNNVK